MRISDWSSDVCSSDLTFEADLKDCNAPDALHRLCDARAPLRGGAGWRAPQPDFRNFARLWHLAEPFDEGGQRLGERRVSGERARALRRRPARAPGSRDQRRGGRAPYRSEEHTSELQSLMRIAYAVLCLKKKNKE